MIIHLNGWPGIGKRTIGGALAGKIGARLVHNHLLHDIAISCCGLNDPARWPLYDKVQAAAYDALAERPRDEVLVMTNALCKDNEREEKAWRLVVDLAARRRARLVPIVLEAEAAEIEQRIQSAERIEKKKLADPAVLRFIMARGTIQKPDLAELLVLDVTALSPEDAAEKIRAHVAALPAAEKVAPRVV